MMGRGQARGGVGRWQTSAETGKLDGPSKDSQKQRKMIPFREEKLNSIGFVWMKRADPKVCFAALKSFKEKEGGVETWKAEDKREVVWQINQY